MRSYITTLLFMISYAGFKALVAKEFNMLTDGTIICMLIILFLDATVARKKIIGITKKLKTVTSELGELGTVTETQNLTKGVLLGREASSFFGNVVLDNKIVQFLRDRSVASKNLENVDIADYINEDVVADATYQDVTDLIAGIMTGLGIFGTFIGLAAGLQGFNTSDTSIIMNSITNLMEGIKVAFYTSIFGVAASLIYNYFYRTDIRNNTIAIEEFHKIFYKYISPEDGFKNTIYALQEKQTQALDRLSKDIAGELAKAMNDSVVPIMNELKTATFGYIEKAVETQSETLEGIVASFMKKMNASLKNQFNELSSSIETMCHWQTEMTELCKSLKDAGDSLKNTSEAVSGIRDNYRTVFMTLESSVTKMAEYMGTLKTYQSDVQGTIDVMQNAMIKHETSAEMQLSAAAKLNSYFESSDTYIKNVEETYKSSEEYLQSLSGVTSSIKDMAHMMTITVAAGIKTAQEYSESTDLLKQCYRKLEELKEEIEKEVSGKVQNDVYEKLSAEIDKQTSDLRKIVRYQAETSQTILQSAEKLQSPIMLLISAIRGNGSSKSTPNMSILEDNKDEVETNAEKK